MFAGVLMSEAMTLWGVTILALSDSNVSALIQVVGVVLSAIISAVALIVTARLTKGVRDDRRSHKQAAAEVKARSNGGDGDDG